MHVSEWAHLFGTIAAAAVKAGQINPAVEAVAEVAEAVAAAVEVVAKAIEDTRATPATS